MTLKIRMGCGLVRLIPTHLWGSEGTEFSHPRRFQNQKSHVSKLPTGISELQTHPSPSWLACCCIQCPAPCNINIIPEGQSIFWFLRTSENMLGFRSHQLFISSFSQPIASSLNKKQWPNRLSAKPREDMSPESAISSPLPFPAAGFIGPGIGGKGSFHSTNYLDCPDN